MLIDIVEPILETVQFPAVSMTSKTIVKQLISYKSRKIPTIHSQTARISLREQVPRCSLLKSSSIVPDYIVDYIEKESKAYTTYQLTYKDRLFKIIMVYENEIMERKKVIVVEDMFKWLTMIVDIGGLSSNCGKTTAIYCYLTPFKKELPKKHGEILSYDNANSAVTTSCSETNEICIFREEELFKVFIHETFHAFNLDFSLHIKNQHVLSMKHMFNIKSEFNIYETYAEVWAEIINIVFLSDDWNVANKLLQAEAAFSLNQMNLVLTYMGLDYSDLIKGHAFHKYREETNIFCYYVLKTLVLFYWSDFVDFCGGSIKYTKNVGDFIEFIREKYTDTAFIKAASSSLDVGSIKSMRMTLWEN